MTSILRRAAVSFAVTTLLATSGERSDYLETSERLTKEIDIEW